MTPCPPPPPPPCVLPVFAVPPLPPFAETTRGQAALTFQVFTSKTIVPPAPAPPPPSFPAKAIVSPFAEIVTPAQAGIAISFALIKMIPPPSPPSVARLLFPSPAPKSFCRCVCGLFRLPGVAEQGFGRVAAADHQQAGRDRRRGQRTADQCGQMRGGAALG